MTGKSKVVLKKSSIEEAVPLHAMEALGGGE
jgi:hypothetical protein